MATLKIIVEIALIAISILLNIVVLSQEGKSAGLGSIGGVSSNLDSYWSQNKGRSMEGVLVKVTRFMTIAFLALAAVLCIGSFQ